MSFNVSKTSSIPCLQKLVDAINADVAIVTVCEFIRLDEPDTMTLTFQGTGPLPPSEDTALDALLGSFTCPPQVVDSLVRFLFNSPQFENPNNADWVVNSLAPNIADPNDPGLSVRVFDDTTPEGVGFTLPVPNGATNMVVQFRNRRRTSGVDTPTVTLDIYNRKAPAGGVVGSWSSATALTALTMPTSLNFMYDTETLSLATLGVTAGETTQFELVRNGGTLSGDWTLLQMIVEFN